MTQNIFALLTILAIILSLLALIAYILLRQDCIVATHLVHVNSKGTPMADLLLPLGKTAVVTIVPKDDAGGVDTTVEDIIAGYTAPDSGLDVAPDGSSKFTLDGLTLTVSSIALSPLDGEGAPILSEIHDRVDADSGPGTVLVPGLLRVAIVAPETIATHIDHEIVINP